MRHIPVRYQSQLTQCTDMLVACLSIDKTFYLNLNLQGRGIGIVVGCVLGMFPLLFYKEPETDKLRDESDKTY